MLRKKLGASRGAVFRWGASSAGGSGRGDRLVKSQRWAVKAVARERNGCLIPRYTGEGPWPYMPWPGFIGRRRRRPFPRLCEARRAPTAGFLFAKNSLTKAGKTAILGMQLVITNRLKKRQFPVIQLGCRFSQGSS